MKPLLLGIIAQVNVAQVNDGAPAVDAALQSGHGVDWRLESHWPFAAGWLIALGIGFSLLLAWWQWRQKASSGRLATSSRWRGGLIWALRSGVVAILVWMIGGWEVTRFETDLPDLVVMLDASRSMSLPMSDSAAGSDKTRWQAANELLTKDEGRLWNRLAKEYRLRPYLVGSELRPLPNDFQALEESLRQQMPADDASRLGDHWLRAIEVQRGRSTAAMLLLSDGVVTEGVSLAEASQALRNEPLPLVIVRVGSADPPPQASIQEVIADANAMVGDVVSTMVRVHWEGTDGTPVVVSLRDLHSGKVLADATVGVGQTQGNDLFSLTFVATESGTRRLNVEIMPLLGEVVLDDNQRETTIDVRDTSFRVLLVQGAPSYEFRFLKHLLERATSQDGSRPLVDLISVLQTGDPQYADQDRTARRLPPVDSETLEQLDLIILSDCDLAALGPVLMNRLADLVTQDGASLVVIAGPRYLPQRLAGTPLEKLLPLDPSRVTLPNSLQQQWRWRLTTLGEAMPNLRVGEELNGWTKAPTFFWLAHGSSLRPGARVLLETESTVGNPLPLPILVSQLAGNGQVWMQLTDEMFRLHSVDLDGAMYERYWLQLIRSLARRLPVQNGEEARLSVLGEQFPVGKPIAYQVRLGSALAAIAGGTLDIEVSDAAGERTRFTAAAQSGGGGEYRGLIEGLSAGTYRVVLTRPVGVEDPPSDSFVVVENPQEMRQAAVDVAMLESVAEQMGGRVISIGRAERDLSAAIPAGRSVRIRPLPPLPIWNHWGVALAVFGLLCSEWIIRRRWGLTG